MLGHGLCRCNRESRHRGVCNARAAAPGFTPAQEEPVCFDDLPKEELGSVKEEPSEGHNDSEQGRCLLGLQAWSPLVSVELVAERAAHFLRHGSCAVPLQHV